MTFRSALITGASSGLGQTVAKLLAHQGVELTITGKDASKLALVKSSLEAHTKVHSLTLDLTSQEDIHRLQTHLEDSSYDLVVLSAGIGLYGPILSHSLQESMGLLHLNLMTTTKLTIACAKAWHRRNHSGTLVIVGSAAESCIYPTFCLYAASKGFLKQFALGFNAELSEDIHVLCFSPGPLNTPFRMRASRGFSTEPDNRALCVEKAAQRLLQQALDKTPHVVYDYRYKIGCFLLKCIPRRIQYALLKRAIRNRYDQL